MKKDITKKKFVLSADMVQVEPEPLDTQNSQEIRILKKRIINEPQEQLSLKISAKIKMEFQIYCVKNGITMKEAIESCLTEYVKK